MILHYDVGRLRELLRHFHVLSRMRVVIFDASFGKIAEYPDADCEFCSLIRGDPDANRRCLDSDRIACETSKGRNSLYSYTCHAGLTETVAPIKYGNLVIGYLMFGQVLQHRAPKRLWQEVVERCAGYSVPEDRLKAAFFQKKPVAPEQVRAAAQILEACAGYLWASRLVSLAENSLPRQIDAHVAENLAADLSAKALCRHFSISRAKLYTVSKEFFGTGIEGMVRAMRIDRARELLETTKEPVAAIAARVGCADYNYFSKMFKKATGMAPTEYRKTRQKQPPPRQSR